MIERVVEMSIKKAANFASKMNKEGQHSFYQCCRIAADYYDVSATDVQKELASRAGTKANGRKYKHVVIYRVPEEERRIRKEEELQWRDFYFSKIKTTTNPQAVVRSYQHIDTMCESYNVYCKIFDNKAEATKFSKENIDKIKRNIIYYELSEDEKQKEEEIFKEGLRKLSEIFSHKKNGIKDE